MVLGTMQGTLNEIDIRSIIQLIALGQRTGELFVEAYPSSPINSSSQLPSKNNASFVQKPNYSPSWFVFFINGQITYATNQTNSRLGRLKDYLRLHKVQPLLQHLSTSEISTTNDPEYAYLWLLLEKKAINPAQARYIIENMVRETLFDLFSLHQGFFIFEMGTPLTPQLTSLAVAPLIAKMVKQVQQWKQFYPHIQSPEQRLQITNPTALQAALPNKAYQSLAYWSDGRTSLRQLARYLNRDLFALAKGIYPYAERGWLNLINSSNSLLNKEKVQKKTIYQSQTSPPHIVCIDDDVTIGKTIETMLSDHGYLITVIKNPLEALSQLFHLNPDVILCDIAMPTLDGYEICAMIRHSHAFCQTPLIMLTGKDAFMDRVRARMAGATDYLTKPFDENELLFLLEQYTQPLRHRHSSLL